MTQELTDRCVIAIPDKLLLCCKAVAGDEGCLEKLSEFVGDHSPMRLLARLWITLFFSSSHRGYCRREARFHTAADRMLSLAILRSASAERTP